MQIDDNMVYTTIGGLVSAIGLLYTYINLTIKSVVKRLEESIDNCEKEGVKKDARIQDLEKNLAKMSFEVGFLKGYTTYNANLHEPHDLKEGRSHA